APTASGAWPLSSPSSPAPEPVGGPAPWGITVAGSLGYDDLTTPAGSRRRVPGGSALYFTLAAAPLAPVRVVGAVGGDGASLIALLQEAGAESGAVRELPGLSYRWEAVHQRNRAAPGRAEQHFGVYRAWVPELPSNVRRSELVFLGSMAPAQQLAVLSQTAGHRLVAADTMSDFVSSDRFGLEQVLEGTDLLFVNVPELRALHDGSEAAPRQLAREGLERWSLRALVLKLGERGSVVVHRDGISEVAAAPGVRVVDPTGAGDALAGRMLGWLARRRRDDLGELVAAAAEGAQAAGWAISNFGTEGLRQHAREVAVSDPRPAAPP
ncbi:MAG: PfkB family carbohydrate kinase, partial [Streptosporangiaceae bacterium]